MAKQKKCRAQGCTETFEPKTAKQLYHSSECANREKQRRLRERAKVSA